MILIDERAQPVLIDGYRVSRGKMDGRTVYVASFPQDGIYSGCWATTAKGAVQSAQDYRQIQG